MEVLKIPIYNGHYNIFKADNAEFVNPVEHYSELIKQFHFHKGYDILIRKKYPIPVTKFAIINFMKKVAEKEWKKEKKRIESTKIPAGLINLFNTTSKKEQLELLKKLRMTSTQLLALIFKAWNDFGYKYSHYLIEHLPNDINKSDLPTFYYHDKVEDELEKAGKTKYSDAQLKHAISYRNVTIAKFLDNGDRWHCFFTTFKSMKGEESWEGGKPHYHYISDCFGMRRDKVLKQLRSKNYKLGNLPHIGFIK